MKGCSKKKRIHAEKITSYLFHKLHNLVNESLHITGEE